MDLLFWNYFYTLLLSRSISSSWTLERETVGLGLVIGSLKILELTDFAFI